MTRRVGIYARLSQDRTGEQTATARQLADCRKLCDLKGWEVARVYEDVDFSAYRKNRRGQVRRPAFAEMLADLEAGLIEGIVIWKLDRLCRRVGDFSKVYDACETRKAPLASVIESFDTSTAMGKFAATMLVAAAELESANISVRVKRAHEEAKANGQWTGGGRRPFGMAQDRKTTVQEEADLLREAAERVIGGDGLRGIANDFSRRGSTTTAGNPWTGSNLRNTLLTEWSASIIGEDKAARLYAVLRDPARRTVDASAEVGLLTGLVRCGLCGSPLNLKSHVSHGRPRRRYTCNRSVGPNRCGRVSAYADVLDVLVRDAVFEALDSEGLTLAEQGSDTEAFASLRADEQALEELGLARFVERTIDHPAYLKARAALEARIADGRKKLARSAGAPVLEENIGALRQSWETKDTAWRRRLLGLLVERVVVNQGKQGPKFDPNRVEIVWKA